MVEQERRPHETSQSSFTKNADLYDKARPSYTSNSIDALIRASSLSPASRILDLACGTGIFTRLLLERGFTQITAADPSPGMRSTFKNRTPGVNCIDAHAHRIPFPDASFDVVTVAQAFHWFADQAALQELARVLTDDGHLCLIWNLETPRTGTFQDAYVNAIVRHDGDVPQYRKNEWQGVLNATTQFETPYEEWIEHYNLYYNPEELWLRSKSKSFITSLSDAEQEGLKVELDDIISAHPDAERDSEGRLKCPQFVRVVTMQKKRSDD